MPKPPPAAVAPPETRARAGEDAGGAAAAGGGELAEEEQQEESSETGAEAGLDGVTHGNKPNNRYLGVGPLLQALTHRLCDCAHQDQVPMTWAGDFGWDCSKCTQYNSAALDGSVIECSLCGEPRPELPAPDVGIGSMLIHDSVGSLVLAATNVLGQASEFGVARGAAEVTVQTAQPVVPGESILDIHVPGSNAMFITFNGTPSTRPGTWVEFYQDEALTRLVAQRHGPTSAFAPFMAPCSRLYAKTVYTPTEGVAWKGWGCTARGLQGVQWMNELDVQLSSSIEWSTWLLQFIASDVMPPAAIRSGILHRKGIVDALCTYLRAPRVPFR